MRVERWADRAESALPIWNVVGFDQVDDGEQHQWLVGRDAPRGGAGGVEIGEFTEPEFARGIGHWGFEIGIRWGDCIDRFPMT